MVTGFFAIVLCVLVSLLLGYPALRLLCNLRFDKGGMCLDGTYPLYGVVLFSFPMYLSILVHAKRLTGQQLFLPERFRISYLITLK